MKGMKNYLRIILHIHESEVLLEIINRNIAKGYHSLEKRAKLLLI